MKISKEYINNIDYEIILRNDTNAKFKIYFNDSNLYWTMIDYYDDNEFVISDKDKYLFNYFNCLFDKIKKYDNDKKIIVDGNTINWKSENDIIVKNVSELLITRKENLFIIKFIRNKRDFLSEFHNSCDICFNLNNSNYKEIVHLFSMIYICYEEKERGISKIKTL